MASEVMEPRQYREADRTRWPSGPWDAEPDHVELVVHGFPCLLIRGPQGAWCGYVGVPQGHPWENGERMDEAVENVYGEVIAHGAASYWLGSFPFPWDESRAVWYGFDCNHACDVAPKYGPEPHHPTAVYRDIAFARGEVEKLAWYAAEAKRMAAPALLGTCVSADAIVDSGSRGGAWPSPERVAVTGEREVVKNDNMEQLATRIMESLAVSGETQAVHLAEVVRMLRVEFAKPQIGELLAHLLATRAHDRAKRAERYSEALARDVAEAAKAVEWSAAAVADAAKVCEAAEAVVAAFDAWDHGDDAETWDEFVAARSRFDAARKAGR